MILKSSNNLKTKHKKKPRTEHDSVRKRNLQPIAMQVLKNIMSNKKEESG